jgi:hypothetical protein
MRCLFYAATDGVAMNQENQTVSRPLAPEDIRVGEFISVLQVVAEYLPGCWCDVNEHQPPMAKRFVHLPTEGCDPMEVEGVCLPFVLVKTHEGVPRTLDVRRYRFAQLEKSYGRRAFDMLQQAAREAAARKQKEDDNE